MQSKPELSKHLDVIIHPAPEGAGRTTPEQTGHSSHYNTKLTNVPYCHGNSNRIALTEPPSRPSCSWKSSEHCHPLCTWINAIASIVLNEGHKLTCWIWCMFLQVLICVWSQMNCSEWVKISLEFNLVVRHTSGHTEPATWSYDVTLI